jgi:ABC-type multidrug transport system ATPase subunit
MSAPAAQPVLVPDDLPTRRASSSTDSVFLQIEGLTKRWDSKGPPVLDDVSLALPRSTLMMLVGRNGVGKTTLLRIVAGVIAPNRGTVVIDGLQALRNRRQYAQRVGFLSAHQGGLYPRLTAKQHLDYWARIAFIPRALRGAAIKQAVDRFALGEFLARRADRISMGQRQRLRLALTFLHDPSLILLDEPGNSLDAEGIALLLQVLEDSRARGGAVIWCTPTADGSAIEPDLLYELEEGKLVLR